MNIGILTHNTYALSHKRLMELGRARGHTMCIIHLSYCYMSISATNPKIFYREHETFEHLDAIIPRISREHTYYGTALLRQFERLKIFTLNNALSILWSRDKLRALQNLAKSGIPIPLMGVADSPQESEKLIELVGGVPLIIRLLEGPEGKGTIFAETEQAAISVINAFKQLKSNILVQEYIQEGSGNDIRCIVVGNKVIGAVLRKFENQAGKLRRHVTRCQSVQLTAQEKKMVIQAAKTMKLNLACVDLIRSKRGPLVLDIEGSPNIELLEKITKIDINKPILKFIEHTLNTWVLGVVTTLVRVLMYYLYTPGALSCCA